MTEYRRFQHTGATWSFTVNLGERITQSREKPGERVLWQQWFWETLFATKGIIGNISTTFIGLL